MIQRWVFWLLSLLAPIAFLLFIGGGVCLGTVSTVYRSVTDPSDDPRAGIGENVSTGPARTLFTPEYQVRGERLYLRVQDQRSMAVMVGVSDTEWDEARIRAFRARHPELEQYWPDPKRPDGGVRWLRR